ncbi:MAG: hypothetical protein HY323_13400 [Betaproteobacteria bacterium]|nr:hypothetical protein [Betaproteobacteria bacterium]
MQSLSILLVAALLTGCAGVRSPFVSQPDLDAWVGVPVIALDTHSLFLTVPMVRTITDSGVEIRNYINKRGVSSCGGSGFGLANSPQGSTLSYTNFNAFQNCTSGMVGCDNIFYIRDGKVIEYKPVGRCYTNEAVRPEKGYERFLK